MSTDTRNWDTRSSIDLVSIAVSPTAADTVVGTDVAGLKRSGDGGRSWRGVAAAPPLVWVSWDANAGLWGATAAGELWRSSDAASWNRTGSVSAMTGALYAHPSGIYVATDKAVLRSIDEGRTFETILAVGK